MLSLGLQTYEMELETQGHLQIRKQLGFHEHQFACTSLGLTSYETELEFSDLFTSYEMELEAHGHAQIQEKLGFHEHQFACCH